MALSIWHCVNLLLVIMSTKQSCKSIHWTARHMKSVLQNFAQILRRFMYTFFFLEYNRSIIYRLPPETTHDTCVLASAEIIQNPCTPKTCAQHVSFKLLSNLTTFEQASINTAQLCSTDNIINTVFDAWCISAYPFQKYLAHSDKTSPSLGCLDWISSNVDILTWSLRPKSTHFGLSDVEENPRTLIPIWLSTELRNLQHLQHLQSYKWFKPY